MRRLAQKLTYTNVVGTLALFIALGGVSWAATLPKNSVGTKQLKKNSVTTTDLQKSAVTNSKIKNNSVTGADINIASLGTVPSASLATTAGSVASRITPVVKRVAVSASNPSPDAALAAASDVPLISSGSFSLVGKCFQVGSDVIGTVVLRSTVDAAVAWNASSLTAFGIPFFFEGFPLLGSLTLPAATVASNSSSAQPAGAFNDRGIVIAPDRHGIRYRTSAFVKNGTLAAGDGIYGPGGSCILIASAERF